MMNRTSVAKQSQMLANLTNLSPFSDYQVTVDCIPLIGDKVVGFWSDRTLLEFTTKQDGLFVVA